MNLCVVFMWFKKFSKTREKPVLAGVKKSIFRIDFGPFSINFLERNFVNHRKSFRNWNSVLEGHSKPYTAPSEISIRKTYGWVLKIAPLTSKKRRKNTVFEIYTDWNEIKKKSPFFPIFKNWKFAFFQSIATEKRPV